MALNKILSSHTTLKPSFPTISKWTILEILFGFSYFSHPGFPFLIDTTKPYPEISALQKILIQLGQLMPKEDILHTLALRLAADFSSKLRNETFFTGVSPGH